MQFVKVLHCLLRIHKPLQTLNVGRIKIPGCSLDTVLLYPENRLLDRFLLLSRSCQLFDPCIEKCRHLPVLPFFCKLVHDLRRIRLSFCMLFIQKFSNLPVQLHRKVLRCNIAAYLIKQLFFIDQPGKQELL